MHQSRMKPLKPFSRWTRNTSSLPEIIRFFSPLLYSQIFPYLPPLSLPPTFRLLPSIPSLRSHCSKSRSRVSIMSRSRVSRSRASKSKSRMNRVSTSMSIGSATTSSTPTCSRSSAHAWSLKLVRSNLELGALEVRPMWDSKRELKVSTLPYAFFFSFCCSVVKKATVLLPSPSFCLFVGQWRRQRQQRFVVVAFLFLL